MFVDTHYLTPRIGVVKINKPKSLNAVSSELLKELTSVIAHLESDANLRVILDSL